MRQPAASFPHGRAATYAIQFNSHKFFGRTRLPKPGSEELQGMFAPADPFILRPRGNNKTECYWLSINCFQRRNPSGAKIETHLAPERVLLDIKAALILQGLRHAPDTPRPHGFASGLWFRMGIWNAQIIFPPDVQPIHLVTQRRSLQTQSLGRASGTRDPPVRCLERNKDGIPF